MKTVIIIFTFLVATFSAVSRPSFSSTPTADFTATTVCQGNPTIFTNNSSSLSGSIVASVWDFGDGQGSSSFEPQHVYANSGTYAVTLTVFNTIGDVDDVTVLVTVNPKAAANFSYAGGTQCTNDNFSFTNTSGIVSGSISSYTWDFGDGSGASSTNAAHAYSAAGTFEVTLTSQSNLGCVSSIKKNIEVFPRALVNFEVDDVCQDAAASFQNETQVASGTVSFAWDFADGNASVSRNPSHPYTASGAYNVSLTATTNRGCVSALTKMVNIHPVPTALFTINDHCFGVAAPLTNQSSVSSGSLSASWSFGDGNFANSANPVFVYQRTGTFLVTLSIQTPFNCEASFQRYVNVNPTPVVDFSAPDVCLTDVTRFANLSTVAQGSQSYEWNFADGNSSAAASPEHTYTTAGTYDVQLQATSAYGNCSAAIQKQIVVRDRPIASFTAVDNCLDSLIKFTNTTLYAGNDVSYEWTLGNGSTSNAVNPALQYSYAQTYAVTLKAMAGNSCESVFSKNVMVFPKPRASFSVDNACDGLPVQFRDFSFVSAGNISHNWSFGDNQSATSPSPAHQYAADGTYEILLRVTSEKGCYDTQSKTITVYPLPITSFSFEPVCEGNETTFKNNTVVSSGFIKSFLWDFGDQSTSIVTNPKKEYLNSGSYNVSLTAVSDKNCQTSVAREVGVYERPVANFSVSDVCSSDPATFNNSSFISTGSLQYVWHFGNGATTIATNPVYRYPQFGVYTASLVATSDTGCKDSVARPLAIFAAPQINAGSDVSVSQGYSVQLQALGALNFEWQPIDGLSNSSIANPIARPLMSTTYVVTGRDQYGCASSDTVAVNVINDFVLVASNVLTPDGNGKNDTWVIDNVETFGSVKVQVYDRWGTLVFEKDAYQNDWRGEQGDNLLPDGTYYYYITFAQSEKVYKGALTILRNNNR